MAPRGSRGKFAWRVGALVGAFLLASALLIRGLAATPRRPPSVGATSTTSASEPGERGVIDLPALRRSCQGTIVRQDERPWFIDGEFESATSAKVAAGPHVIAVGAKQRTVEVPCEASIVVR
jgi:hypothetical protein